ncbi:GAF domain-containing protein [Mycobacterium sp. M1]|uniref:GAF domain-containing protein n=1 Tax=Mycolicibacter acidiphilus TaxID=2835306 RepID=A0ABS5RFI8_9MYCO|nr:GAF domain-containing protein [Mycolicibacter acidiphilus]MBS9533051.1 GAF domain-containing protein [Mycolicibacter acidiphilus]
MADVSGSSFWGGFVDWVGPHLDRALWVRVLYVLAPTIAATPVGLAGIVNGRGRSVCLILGGLVLLLMAVAEVVRQVYGKHLRESDDADAAARVVTLRDALRPIATAIADMQTSPKDKRRDRANEIAGRGAEALALVMARISGLRSVVYREEGDALNVLECRGRSDRMPQPFRRGDPRGDAAFLSIERREPVFVHDVGNGDAVAAVDGAYHGSRAGYRTFISAPVADQQRTYGMLTVDAPNPGDLLKSDTYLVMLVADLLAIAFASVRERD